ncbi:MAG TPA: heme exporter protein CcmB [Actinomycetota bacterium]|nr:heme exporter protein CcmB [Actinomycetota bacterium]
MTSLLGGARILAAKDLKVEARAKETFPPMLAFAFAVTVLLSFTLPAGSDLQAPREIPPLGTVAVADVLAGFLWVTILFAGLIGFARTFEAEREDGAIEALLLSPVDRSALWIAKASANLAFIAAIELFLLPLFALLFGFHLGSGWLTLIGVVALADVGFVSVGTLFASAAAQTRSKELMLPILALPALVPLFLAAVELSSRLFVGAPVSDVASSGWFVILAVYDLVVIGVALLAYEFVID